MNYTDYYYYIQLTDIERSSMLPNMMGFKMRTSSINLSFKTNAIIFGEQTLTVINLYTIIIKAP